MPRTMGVRSVGPPSSTVAQAALDLMISLGGSNDAAAKMIEEMREVQQHNEQVRDEARAATEAAVAASLDLEERKEAFRHEREQAVVNEANTREILEARERSANLRESEAAMAAGQRKQELDDRSVAVDGRERVVGAREQKATAWLAGLATREKSIEARESEVAARESGLEAVTLAITRYGSIVTPR